MSNDLVTRSGSDIVSADQSYDVSSRGHSHVSASEPRTHVDAASDAGVFSSFASALRLAGIDDDTVLPVAKRWYAKFSADADESQHHVDRAHIKGCLNSLRRSWGADYASNMDFLHGLIETMPEEAAEAILESRDESGRLLLNNPSIAHFLVSAARAMDTPPEVFESRRTPTRTDATELEQIHKLMKDRRSDYWRGPRAESLQARYRELIGGDDE